MATRCPPLVERTVTTLKYVFLDDTGATAGAAVFRKVPTGGFRISEIETEILPARRTSEFSHSIGHKRTFSSLRAFRWCGVTINVPIFQRSRQVSWRCRQTSSRERSELVRKASS